MNSPGANSHRKRVKHFHEPGDLHGLTFSCLGRRQILTNDLWRGFLARSIDRASERVKLRVASFVFMPEHVHLLVFPESGSLDEKVVSRFLAAIKRPCSVEVKRDLEATNDPLLQELMVRERPGRIVFRYWQEGSGYDRNYRAGQAVIAAIDYLHANPVRRALVERATDWRWSSARWYASDGQEVDEALPRLHRLPPEAL